MDKDNKNSVQSFSFRLLIYLLLILGYVFSRGFYSFSGVIFLIGILVVLLISLAKPDIIKFSFENSVDNFSALVLILSTFLSLLLYGGLYQQYPQLVILSKWILLICISLSLSFLFVVGKHTLFSRTRFLTLLLFAFSLRLIMIISSPYPKIDVFDILKFGPINLIAGQNPYSATYNKLYSDQIPDYFSYFPGTLFAFAPFVTFLGDPRYLYVFADAVTFFCLMYLTKRNRYGEDRFYLSQTIPLIFLFNPMSLYLLENSYLDPLPVAGLSLFALLILSKKINLAMAVFGFLLTTKHLLFLGPIFLFKFLGYKKIKYWIVMFLTSFIISFPFFLWGPFDFIHDTVLVFLPLPFRPEALTFSAFLNNEGILKFNIIYFIPIWILLLILILKLQKKSFDYFFLSMGIFLLGFFLFNKYAFLEFYYLVSSLVLLSAVTLGEENKS